MNAKYIKWIFVLCILFILLIISTILSLCIGEVYYSPISLYKILTNQSGIEYTIISKIRFPRIILGLAAGGALSLSGVILQGVYRNPLVEPYTLGVSGGAALGIAFAVVFNLTNLFGSYMFPVFGFTGAFITIFFVYFLAVNHKNFTVNRMLLIGVMISFITSSMLMLLMSLTTAQDLQNIIFWIMGSLNETDKVLIYIVLFVSLIGLSAVMLLSNSLNALRLGEAKAKHIGLNTTNTIRILFLISSLLTGISVSVTGVIGFVGLVIPHLMRNLTGNDFRILIPASFLSGSIFLIFSDLISRTVIAPNELPIGVITGIIGGCIFIVILSKNAPKN